MKSFVKGLLFASSSVALSTSSKPYWPARIQPRKDGVQ